MLRTISFVPGAVTAGSNINLPSWAPKIDAVASAFIIRPTNQISIANHPALSHTGTAVADHPAHSHTSIGVKATETAADSTTFVTLKDGTGADVTGVKVSHAGGAGSDITVPSSEVAAMAHTVTQPNDHAAQAHTVTGANPVVSATPTKVDEDTITLNVDTVAGDVLYLTYIARGARLAA